MTSSAEDEYANKIRAFEAAIIEKYKTDRKLHEKISRTDIRKLEHDMRFMRLTKKGKIVSTKHDTRVMKPTKKGKIVPTKQKNFQPGTTTVKNKSRKAKSVQK